MDAGGRATQGAVAEAKQKKARTDIKTIRRDSDTSDPEVSTKVTPFGLLNISN